MQWLIEEDRFHENHVGPMTNTLDQLKIRWKMIKYIPFEENLIPDDFFPSYKEDSCEVTDDNVTVYGSVNLIQYVQKSINKSWREDGNLGWDLGVSDISWDRYNCSKYYPEFSRYIFNGYGAWYPIREVINRANQLLFMHKTFIRPDTATKEFKGGAYEKEEFIQIAKNVIETYPDLWVYVVNDNSIVYNYASEYRLFCVDNKLITGSHYRTRGHHFESNELPQSVIKFAYDILDLTTYRPDPVFAIDIIGHKDQYALLELSPWACAGLYQCDIPKLVRAIMDYYKSEGYL